MNNDILEELNLSARLIVEALKDLTATLNRAFPAKATTHTQTTLVDPNFGYREAATPPAPTPVPTPTPTPAPAPAAPVNRKLHATPAAPAPAPVSTERSLKHVKALAITVLTAGPEGQNTIAALNKKYGVARLSNIHPEKWEEVCVELEKHITKMGLEGAANA
tara:strand:+ start:5188 stop:5676 length:489 start_codon:yes stop_codon:yes gene_type:complete